MEMDKRWDWLGILFATLLAAALMGVIPLVPRPSPEIDSSPGFGWSWDFDYRRAIQEPALTPESSLNQPSAPAPGEVILPLGRTLPVADLRLVYRGPTGAGKFRLDVIIPALDPGYAYAKALTRADQGGELDLYGQRFSVTAINDRVLRLRHLGPQ